MKRRFRITPAVIIALMCLPAAGGWAQEVLRFERLWPTLNQPWYFATPSAIAADGHGFVYIADTGNGRVRKFTEDGQFITEWRRDATGSNGLRAPQGIAVDADRRVYVADNDTARITVYDAFGNVIGAFGTPGPGLGELAGPRALAIDATGRVFVADSLNNRVQIFNDAFEPEAIWRGPGNEFFLPSAVAIGPDGTVYVGDSGTQRIYRFTAEGGFIGAWGGPGTGPGQFNGISAVFVDNAGTLYAVDSLNGRIQRAQGDGSGLTLFDALGPWGVSRPTGFAQGATGAFFVSDWTGAQIAKLTPDLSVLQRWSSRSDGRARLNNPAGIAESPGGDVYVADFLNRRVQRYSRTGQYIESWTGDNGKGVAFDGPFGLRWDPAGFLYVIDEMGSTVYRFTPDGVLDAAMDGTGTGAGPLSGPTDAALDEDGNVYVADRRNDRIVVFDAGGAFLRTWGTPGTGPAQFSRPYGIEILGSQVYVTDSLNHRVQVFGLDGAFIETWGELGTDPGQLNRPQALRADGAGGLYIANAGTNRLQRFLPDGTLMLEFGETGSGPGTFSQPWGLGVGADGRVYVGDSFNHRVQVFQRRELGPESRAIVVAAGGPYPGNTLWDATQFCANYAYRALVHQGYTRDTIQYLSSDLDLDLDGNGVADDVDGDATNANLEQALTEWAVGADSLVVYLVDHGGIERFRMSGTEILEATALAGWLAEAESQVSGRVTVVYEACQSGSFLDALSQAGRASDRVTIASSAADENAYFLGGGTVSFSNFFWTHVFNGSSVGAAFDAARGAVGLAVGFQSPQLDDNGNGTGNDAGDGPRARATFLGNGAAQASDAPLIMQVSPVQAASPNEPVTLYADVAADAGVSRVWAVVTPPHIAPPPPGQPVLDLPTVDLYPVAPPLSPSVVRWRAAATLFDAVGTYPVAIYARDAAGRTAPPQLTALTVGAGRRDKAIIAAGGTGDESGWPAIEQALGLAYETLRRQGFEDGDICFLSPVTFSAGIDGGNTLDNFEFAFTEWAADAAHGLTVYVAGPGGDQVLPLGPGEALSAPLLDAWLDGVEGEIPGTVTVLLDACFSGSFLAPLTPGVPGRRIVMTSTGPDQPAYFAPDGSVSFSRYFWQQIANGAWVWSAFQHARTATEFSAKATAEQSPLLDDNGNGRGNEKSDGQLARQTRIGAGLLLGADEPVVGAVSDPQVLDGVATALIEAKQVAATQPIARVWAVIVPPVKAQFDLCSPATAVELTLPEDDKGGYGAAFDLFTTPGPYDVAIFAVDVQGHVSIPARTVVDQHAAVDGLPLGDVNGDHRRNAADLQAVINTVLGIDMGVDADINADGRVDASDIQWVINLLLSLE